METKKGLVFIGIVLGGSYLAYTFYQTYRDERLPKHCMKCVDKNNSWNTFLEFCAPIEGKVMNIYFDRKMSVNDYKSAMEEYNPKFPNQDIECNLI